MSVQGRGAVGKRRIFGAKCVIKCRKLFANDIFRAVDIGKFALLPFCRFLDISVRIGKPRLVFYPCFAAYIPCGCVAYEQTRFLSRQSGVAAFYVFFHYGKRKAVGARFNRRKQKHGERLFGKFIL